MSEHHVIVLCAIIGHSKPEPPYDRLARKCGLASIKRHPGALAPCPFVTRGLRGTIYRRAGNDISGVRSALGRVPSSATGCFRPEAANGKSRMRSPSDASKTSVKWHGRARVGLLPHFRSKRGLRRPAAVPLGAAIAPRPLVRVLERVAPIAVPAVIMMHIAARTPGRVTSRQRDCRCLTGQKSLCPDQLDCIASIAPETQLDAVKVIVGVLRVRHPGRPGVLPSSPV